MVVAKGRRQTAARLLLVCALLSVSAGAAAADPANADLTFVRLRSPAEVRGFLTRAAVGADRT